MPFVEMTKIISYAITSFFLNAFPKYQRLASAVLTEVRLVLVLICYSDLKILLPFPAAESACLLKNIH
jgi:hypothetical protein